MTGDDPAGFRHAHDDEQQVADGALIVQALGGM
jgi:hypothetical protein